MLKIQVLNSETGKSEEKILKPEKEMRSECIVGRHSSCDLRLDDGEGLVSRVHARIIFQDGQYYFSDLGSTDGSRVNNQDVLVNELCPLRQGDVISICQFVLLVQKVELNDLASTAKVSSQIVESGSGRWSKGKIKVQCVQVIDETNDVKTFRFVANPPVLFDYKPGQFVTLDLPINGEQVKRSYSISSTPSRPHTLEITVKRVPAPNHAAHLPPGLVSNWLHDNIKVGSEINLNGPRGKFSCFPDPANKLLLLSAGSGITPMMSMSRFLCDTAADVDIMFCHSAKTPRDIIFRQELELMAANYPHFKLAIPITRPQAGQAWLGYTGRLNASLLQVIAPDFKERTVYVCGPEPFMEAAKSLLEGLGFPMDNYYEESFGGAPAEPATPVPAKPEVSNSANGKSTFSAPNQSQSNGVISSESAVIYLDESGQEIAIPWDTETTIPEAAEETDAEIEYSCLSGTCGSCKMWKREGNVEYTKEPGKRALRDSDREKGYILTCIAKPLGKVVLSPLPS